MRGMLVFVVVLACEQSAPVLAPVPQPAPVAVVPAPPEPATEPSVVSVPESERDYLVSPEAPAPRRRPALPAPEMQPLRVGDTVEFGI